MDDRTFPRLKPEFQRKLDERQYMPRMTVRLLTQAETEAKERERTKDYRPCICCQHRLDPRNFKTELPVCSSCAFGFYAFKGGNGRGSTDTYRLMIATATAVARTLERTAWRMQRQNRL